MNIGQAAQPDMEHLKRLPAVAADDVKAISEKEQTYRGSWKRRGGVGAFMMLARKWDRLEEILRRASYDIFAACSTDGARAGRDGTALAEVRDLRRYLLLVESELRVRDEGHGDAASCDKPGAPDERPRRRGPGRLRLNPEVAERIDALARELDQQGQALSEVERRVAEYARVVLEALGPLRQEERRLERLAAADIDSFEALQKVRGLIRRAEDLAVPAREAGAMR